MIVFLLSEIFLGYKMIREILFPEFSVSKSIKNKILQQNNFEAK